MKNAGLVLLAIGVLARMGVGLYAASSDPSVTLLSWEGLQAVLAPGARGRLPSELRLVLGVLSCGSCWAWPFRRAWCSG